ncbi:MAG: glycosyltransferase family 2 protein, partial [Chitinivibrionales bacterium]|nr:glycosyltransferase family 2 protein [Chitinivibrionales bacterium]
GAFSQKNARIHAIETSAPFSTVALHKVTAELHSEFMLFLFPPAAILLEQYACQRLLQTTQVTGAALIYADYRQMVNTTIFARPVLDYTIGSVRDGFDFGPFIFCNVAVMREVLGNYSTLNELQYAAIYDLRLKLSIAHQIHHIPETLCTKFDIAAETITKNQFDYVDPANRAVQQEYEEAFSHHLKRINAYLKPEYTELPQLTATFPVEISVVIPVLNREKTIQDSINSALKQQCSVLCNIIVVDNHSTDGTSSIIEETAQNNSRIKHLIPKRTDLGIGGCWNEALFSRYCGKYVVQLDSDDLYADEFVLQKMYDLFESEQFAMIIGSYTIVDFSLNPIPPGLIDHREWTDDNGRNNCLRINGLGAPRALRSDIARLIRFPNVSYGEDYAMCLTLCRSYKIGRIYESLYYCRRWEGNSDSNLPIDTVNKHDSYKDYLRRMEITARQKLNKK